MVKIIKKRIDLDNLEHHKQCIGLRRHAMNGVFISERTIKKLLEEELKEAVALAHFNVINKAIAVRKLVQGHKMDYIAYHVKESTEEESEEECDESHAGWAERLDKSINALDEFVERVEGMCPKEEEAATEGNPRKKSRILPRVRQENVPEKDVIAVLESFEQLDKLTMARYMFESLGRGG